MSQCLPNSRATLSPFILYMTYSHTRAAGTDILQHSHSGARGAEVSAATYQRRPMPRMQRLCMSLPSGLVSWSATMSAVGVYTKAMAPPVTCSRTK